MFAATGHEHACGAAQFDIYARSVDCGIGGWQRSIQGCLATHHNVWMPCMRLTVSQSIKFIDQSITLVHSHRQQGTNSRLIDTLMLLGCTTSRCTSYLFDQYQWWWWAAQAELAGSESTNVLDPNQHPCGMHEKESLDT